MSNHTTDIKAPEEYTGELLCSRCARGQETGNYYAHCSEINPATGKKYEHAESCGRYHYMKYDGICPACEREMEKEEEERSAN